MSVSRERRNEMKERKRSKEQRTKLFWTLGWIALVALVGYMVWISLRPAEGTAVPLEVAEHIEEGTDPGEYSSNPPTSGQHYGRPLPAGFYEESDLEAWAPYPLGYAVHSLEHGYIVFWYNCDLLSSSECDTLKTKIGDYMNRSLVPKLIAYPLSGNEFPLVLTSWGYMLELQDFNAREASIFIDVNRLKAPEPNAP
ncbi:MAG: DUF3105 domain-containing protein [Chloroflexi bacterium]|nr:DUF3105 domain-containing protein [Chloroflexota bacterium]